MKSVLKLSERRHRESGIAASFLEHHEFKSVYQPILSPTHQKLVGYEALVRVRRGNQPVTPPDLFEQASVQGVTAELDQHLLNLHLENFHRRGEPVWLFININPDTLFHHADYLEYLARYCEQLGLRPDSIVLELVETASRDTATLLEFVQEAKALGFQIAIDDFGMGDSNFERLWRINPLIVKVDRSLLTNAQNHPRARLLLNSLVRMIRESGSLVLLEGIENEIQARIALETEADLVQGFLFARPGALTQALHETSETALRQSVSQSEHWTQTSHQARESYLQVLRFEMMEAGHELARGKPFQEVCQGLLGMEGVKRCFLLDQRGVQQGSLAVAGNEREHRFNPLYQSAGACWSHREYFRNALDKPHRVNSSRPYVALPDARRTVTLSTSVALESGRRILCVDIHPDQVLDGQIHFPPVL